MPKGHMNLATSLGLPPCPKLASVFTLRRRSESHRQHGTLAELRQGPTMSSLLYTKLWAWRVCARVLWT